MFKALQLNLSKILFTLFFISFMGHVASAQTDPSQKKLETNKSTSVNIKPVKKDNRNKDSLAIDDGILAKPTDSVQLDSIIKPKSAIDQIVSHKSDSTQSYNLDRTLMTLYYNAEVDYGNVNIKAGLITINSETNIIMARGIIDSTGYVQKPIVVQDGQESTHDSIKMNSKTEKAVAWGTLSDLNGLDTKTGIMKKVNDSTIYVSNISITTSKKPIPDYEIKVDKGKLVPDKKIVGGKSQFIIAEVPTPLILPFSYFPLTKGRTSGIIMPSYGSTREQGFYLQNGGYYLALNEYFDLALMGDIYTNGSWGINAQSNYKVRYKFNGSFGFRYENLFNSIRGLDDFNQSSNYNIRWSHSQDSKSNPNARFSASVNMGSSKYYKESLNEYNSNSFLNNTLSSSVSYQKRFVGTPFNLTSSMTHSQNTNTESIIMSLPSLQVSMDRVYPFAPKNGAKKGMLQNIGTTYNFKGDYRINTTDEFFFKSEMFETAQTGMQHDANLSTNTKVLKHFTLSPNARYKEVWYFDKVNKHYDDSTDEVVTDTIKGFNAFREYNAGASLSTTIYGDFIFKKGSRIEAIRHTIRPSVSYSYRPDFGHYYEEYQYTDDPDDIKEYSPFETGIYGGPSRGLSNSLGLSINNVFEAKVRSKDSTETEAKKISLLKSLNLSTNYNMAADTLKWSPVSMSAGTAFFDNKMGVNLRATMDPYALDVNGRRIDKFNIDNGGSLFRMTNAGLTMNYSIKSKSSKKDTESNSRAARDDTGSDGIFGENMSTTNDPNRGKGNDKEETKTSKIYNSIMPWSVRFAYAMNYSNNIGQNEITSHSLMFSGDIDLTPKWQMGFSSGYDFSNKGFTYTQLRFNRDLDSWRMSFNWVPFGPRTTYNFYIGIKSSIFSDVKYDKRKQPDRALF